MEKKTILREDAELLIEAINLDLFKIAGQEKYFLKKEKAIDELITHKRCECGNLMDKYRVFCDDCIRREYKRQAEERYMKKPFLEWDGKSMLTLYHDDKFFSDEDEILEYLEELNEEREDDEKVKIEDLQLCICAPNNAPLIEYHDLCEDIMPENVDDLSRIAPEILKKVDELNDFIKTHKPISWSEGPFRTTLKSEDYVNR